MTLGLDVGTVSYQLDIGVPIMASACVQRYA